MPHQRHPLQPQLQCLVVNTGHDFYCGQRVAPGETAQVACCQRAALSMKQGAQAVFAVSVIVDAQL